MKPTRGPNSVLNCKDNTFSSNFKHKTRINSENINFLPHTTNKNTGLFHCFA